MAVISPTGRTAAHAYPMCPVLLCSDGSDPKQVAVA